MDLMSLFSLDPSIIIQYMNSLFSSIFNIAQDPSLQEWGNSVITNMAENTEKQVTEQLTHNP